MCLRFSANLNFLFTEGSVSLSERIYRACEAGFRAIEIPFPAINELDEVLKAKTDTGLHVALINIALDAEKYKFGTACIPGAENVFKQQLDDTIKVAQKLNCSKIHIMSGICDSGQQTFSYEDHYKVYESNLKYAANVLKDFQLLGLIEPINNYSVPSYFMNSYTTANYILKSVNSQHLRLMVDFFHLQQICGNVTRSLKTMADCIGHFQIAQVPHRYEPDEAGELNYEYIFQLIKEQGYQDWIGCEYKPKTTTIEGLKWLDKYK